MVQIASVDYDAKRAYLHLDTATSGFDVILAYFEINTLRAANASGEQNRKHLMSAEGNIPKTTTTFTPRFGLVEPGWRFIPYDTPHKLVLKAEIVSKDQLTDKDVFDRTGVTSNVDIDKDYKEVEIRNVATGSGVTEQDKTDIINGNWAKPLEGGMTAEQFMRIFLSALGNKASGLDTLSPVFRDLADGKNRITATTDANGNRTSVILDGT